MSDGIVICGMGCRLAGDLEGWSGLRQALYCDQKRPIFTHPSTEPGSSDLPRWKRPEHSPFAKDALQDGVRVGQVSYESWDPEFFGISPAEAPSVKPNTRLLLESSWHAFEDAGIPPSSLAGSQTAVIMATDGEDGFLALGLENKGRSFFNRFGNSTFSTATISGRLAYFYDFVGPTLNVETACSGGLVALHYGVQSILNGESEGALVGGATSHPSPFAFHFLNEAGLISPNARCATHDASADGYVMSEGAVVFYLTKKSTAEKKGLPILAEVASSAVAHAGKARGMLRPTSTSQEALLQTCLKRANLTPSDIDFVEAHGTGTKTGDQVEIEALISVFGPNSGRETPLPVSSSKTSLGHGHEISGLVGLARAILCLSEGVISPHWNLKKPAPYIDPRYIQVSASAQPLSKPQKGFLTAGISSFGFAGTIAHAIVKVPLRQDQSIIAKGDGALLTLSARKPGALAQLVHQCLERVSAGGDIFELCRTSNLHREHGPYRVSIYTSGGRVKLKEKLSSVLTELKQRDATIHSRSKPKLCFLFPPETDQLYGLGHHLCATLPFFRDAVEEARSAVEVVYGDEFALPSCRGDQDWDAVGKFGSDTGTLLVFIYQYALAKTIMQMGVTPDYVLGYSLGEFAAACAAGSLTLQRAVEIICTRERLLRDKGIFKGPGGMLAVRSRPETILKCVEDGEKARMCDIAGRLSPDTTLISGPKDAVEEVKRKLHRDGIYFKELGIEIGYHSSHVHEASAYLSASVISSRELLEIQSKKLFFSSLNGGLCSLDRARSLDFWAEHLKAPIYFRDAVQSVMRQSMNTAQSPLLFVDFSATSSLQQLLKSTAKEMDSEPSWSTVALCRPSVLTDSHKDLLESIGALYERNIDVDFAILWNNKHSSSTSLVSKSPTYPFQRARFWPEASSTLRRLGRATGQQFSPDKPRRESLKLQTPLSQHPLVGDHVKTSDGHDQFVKVLDGDSFEFLEQHKLGDWVVMSMTMLIDAVLTAAQRLRKGPNISIKWITPDRPFSPAKDTKVIFSITLFNDDSFAITSDQGGKIRYAHGLIEPEAEASTSSLDTIDLNEDNLISVGSGHLYDLIRGLRYGDDFRLLKRLEKSSNDRLLCADVMIPSDAARFAIPPGFLDAAAHAVIIAQCDQLGPNQTLFYRSVKGVAVQGPLVAGQMARCYALRLKDPRWDEQRKMHLAFSFVFLDIKGRILAFVEEANLASVQFAADRPGTTSRNDRARDPAPATAPKTSGEVQVRHDLRPKLPSGTEGKVNHSTMFALHSRPLKPFIEPHSATGVFIFTDESRFSRNSQARSTHVRILQKPKDLLAQVASSFEEAQERRYSHVVFALYLRPTSPSTLAQQQACTEVQIRTTLALLRTCAKSVHPAISLSIRIITMGQQLDRTTGEEGRAFSRVEYACLAGVAKTARTEFAHLFDVSAVDIPYRWAQKPEAIAQVLQRISRPLTTDFVFATDVGAEVHLSHTAFLPVAFQKMPSPLLHGTFIITGGLGHLAMTLLPWLVSRGVERVLLVGRRSKQDAKLRTLLGRAMDLSDGRAQYMSADISTLSGVCAVLAEARAISSMPLRGIFHAAMVLSDKAIVRQDWSSFNTALDAKVPGAWHLHEQTLNDHLDVFTLFSSVTSTFGGIGQSNYTAANHFLERMAVTRRAQGLPAVAIQLGPLQSSEAVQGMSTAIGRVFPPLTKAELTRGMESVLSSQTPPVVLLTNLNSSQLRTVSWGRQQHIWSLLAPVTPPISPTVAVQPPTPPSVLSPSEHPAPPPSQGLKPNLRMDKERVSDDPDAHEDDENDDEDDDTASSESSLLQTSPRPPSSFGELSSSSGSVGPSATLAGIIGGMLEMAPEELDPNIDLFDVGLDSLMMVQIASKMQILTGVEFPMEQATGVITIQGLAQWYQANSTPRPGSENSRAATAERDPDEA